MKSQKNTNIELELTSNLYEWRAFLAITQCGSLTRAALSLGTSQSLLSRKLNALEKMCGVCLFYRTGRGMEISDCGKRILQSVKDLLGNAEQLELAIRSQASEPAGVVTIGSLPSLSHPLIAKLFKTVRAQYPSIQLKNMQGSSQEIDAWIADGLVDVGIVCRDERTLADNEDALCTIDNYLIGAPGDVVTRPDEIELAKLDGLPFILSSTQVGLRLALNALSKHHQITLDTKVEVDSLPLIRYLVSEERLYAVMPIYAVWEDVQAGRLQASRIVSPVMQRIVAMVFGKAKGSSKAVSTVRMLIKRGIEKEAGCGL
jgi:DNA-binding transcriptional LysR family regulator